MKTQLIVVTFLSFLQTENKVSELYGDWKLEKIELNEEVLIPTKRDYYLYFSEDWITYNLEYNKCQTMDFSIQNNSIWINRIACTEICCDGRSDTISNYINYSGAYIIQNNQLMISNSESIVYLNRAIEDVPPKPHNFLKRSKK
tara:strand:- start:49 stop:480 length:432 start_codon:yes stop_codon:yes gene_type:complete